MLKPGGRGILAGYSTMLNMLKIIRKGKKAAEHGVTYGSMGMTQANKQDLNTLSEMMESGKITPAIDKVYPLAEASEAMRYFDEEHARAKVILSMCREE